MATPDPNPDYNPQLRRDLEDIGWLRQLARSLVRDPHLAEDLVQDACALALDRDRPVAKPRAWLSTVLHNLFKAHGRREAARKLREQARTHGEADDTAALIERAEAQQALGRAVLQLDEPYRSTVLLRYFDGLQPRQIARRLDVPVATVHSRLQRSLQQLRSRLDRDFGKTGAWALTFASMPAMTSGAALKTTLILMQTKLKIVAAAAAIACTAPLWWPGGSLAEGGEAPPGIEGSERGPRAGSDDSGGGAAGSRAARHQRSEVAAAKPREPKPAAETFTIRGRVCDSVGQAMSGVRVGIGGDDDDAVASAVDGSFELTTTGRRASLGAVGDEHVTVLAGDWTRGSTIPPVVVVARAIAVAGSTVAPDRGPVAGCRVELRLPEDFDTRFSVPLDRAGRSRWHAVSDERGRFDLGRVPGIAGAELVTIVDAYVPTRLPLPTASTDDLELVVERFTYRQGELLGRVLEPSGAPAKGARVAMGLTSVVSDDDGRFGIHLRRAGWPTAIVAAKAGFLPGRFDVPKNGGKRREDWPAEVVVHLGPKPGQVSGRVVDPDGAGIGGAEVWLADPTPLGVAGIMPLQVEYLIGGGMVPPYVARMQVPDADDPTRDGNFMDQATVPEASAGWFYVTTDEQGSFVLPGLLDRPYLLKALDPASGLFGEVAGVVSGSFHEITIRRDAVWPEVRGRVVSLQGKPLAGVAVQQYVTAESVRARVPGGRFEGTALRRGRSTTTGDDGTFTLRDVGRRSSVFALSGDGILPTSIAADDVGDPLQCRFEAEARCHVEVVLHDPTEADEVRCLDARGEEMDIAVLRRNSNQFLTEVPLHQGRSGMFVVGERAGTLVLLRGGEPVRRIPFTPDPARAITLN